jgi:hypothetical protein
MNNSDLNYDKLCPAPVPNFEKEAKFQASKDETEAVNQLLGALDTLYRKNACQPAHIENFLLTKLQLERGSRTMVAQWLEAKRINSGGRI